MTNLARNRDLVDREAASFEILESRNLRQKLIEETEKNDNKRRDEYAREVFDWLNLAGRDTEQEYLLFSFQDARVPETYGWIMVHSKVRTWFDEEDPRRVLWLKGKPGSGTESHSHYRETVFTSHRKDHPCYLPSGESPNVRRISFLVLDGLDEYDKAVQEQIIEELDKLLKPYPDSLDEEPQAKVKVMICCRETTALLGKIRRKFSNALVVNLGEDYGKVSQDISRFTNARLPELYDRFDEDVVKAVGDSIAKKADGNISTQMKAQRCTTGVLKLYFLYQACSFGFTLSLTSSKINGALTISRQLLTDFRKDSMGCKVDDL